MYRVVNPSTNTVIDEVATASDDEIRAAIERAEIMARVGALFAERAGELGEIATLEMGKRTVESGGELSFVTQNFDYYADNAEQLLSDEILPSGTGSAAMQKRPIGAVLGIMPWNYPYYQVARFTAPNLVLGNTVLLKHAPNCPRSAAAIETLLHDAGVPAGAFVNLYASDEQIAWMLADPRVQGVSLTGSERAGAAVAVAVGQRRPGVQRTEAHHRDGRDVRRVRRQGHRGADRSDGRRPEGPVLHRRSIVVDAGGGPPPEPGRPCGAAGCDAPGRRRTDRRRRRVRRADAADGGHARDGGLRRGALRRSGIGRELDTLGIEEFMNKKVIAT